MLRPFDPNDKQYTKPGRIVADSGTGLLCLVTFAGTYAVFLAVSGAAAIVRGCLHGTAGLVHALRRHPA